MTHSGRRTSPKDSKSGSDNEEGHPPPVPPPSAPVSSSHHSANHRNNGGGGDRPYSPIAETLFRKDLISAMKLPDNEPLTADDYWTVTDTWKQEWEKGVQVPFKPEELPVPRISRIPNPPQSANRFAFPKKLMCTSRNSAVYNSDVYQITPMVLRAEQVCSYDMDELDHRWLGFFNGERSLAGYPSVSELEFETCIEHFERQCCDKIHSTLKINEQQDEQDDSILCDVCRSPDSEEFNEMVFCDKCNICVHQACYGITNIPSGSWLCQTCVLGARPKCELCPNKGGAMKCTKSGQKWAHVSCALWIPEVSIGCVEKMEPITKISSIPTSRWNLTCVLCKERVGCCIQCSIKTCKTAYHVTCAFKSGLEMRAIIEDENAEDGVKLRSYCQKHSHNQKRKESEDSDSSDFKSGNKKKPLTAEECVTARQQKLAKIECEFYKNVDVEATVKKTSLDEETVDYIFRYWILKRRANKNRRLLCPRTEETELLSNHDEESEREKLKSFVHLRQDLERVRNLCYMVSRREKLQRSFVKLREQILEKQLSIVADEDNSALSLMEMSAILEANHGPTIYDRIFSHSDAEIHTENDFEVIISRISGEIAENSATIRKDNPYRNKGPSLANSSTSKHRISGKNNDNSKSVYKCIFSENSSSETDDILHLGPSLSTKKKESVKKKEQNLVANKKVAAKPRKTKKSIVSTKSPKKNATRSDADVSDFSSSADEDKLFHSISKKKLEKSTRKKEKAIYTSDSNSETEEKRPRSPVFRTKAAMKDFSVEELPRSGGRSGNSVSNVKSSKITSSKKQTRRNSIKSSKKDEEKKSFTSSSSSPSSPVRTTSSTDKVPSKKGFNSESNDYYPMIVPERAAARKASEKLKVGTHDHSKEKTVNSVQAYDEFDFISNSSTTTKKHRHKKSDSSDQETVASKKNNELLGFVPQRKAAKKASAYLKDSDKQLSASKEEALLTAAASPPTLKKSPGRPRKKESSSLPPLSARLHLSSDSDSDLPSRSASKTKSPRSRHAASSKSPKKSKTKTATSKKEEKKGLSSGALAFLNQRESQLDDFFRDVGLDSSSKKPERGISESPDKKLKTSEGRQPSLPPADASPSSAPGSPHGDSSSGSSSSSESSSDSEKEESGIRQPSPEAGDIDNSAVELPRDHSTFSIEKEEVNEGEQLSDKNSIIPQPPSPIVKSPKVSDALSSSKESSPTPSEKEEPIPERALSPLLQPEESKIKPKSPTPTPSLPPPSSPLPLQEEEEDAEPRQSISDEGITVEESKEPETKIDEISSEPLPTEDTSGSKEESDAENLNFAEKLKVGYANNDANKEDALETIEAAPSPPPEKSKQKPQTDEGYVSAEIAQIESGAAAILQELPTVVEKENDEESPQPLEKSPQPLEKSSPRDLKSLPSGEETLQEEAISSEQHQVSRSHPPSEHTVEETNQPTSNPPSVSQVELSEPSPSKRLPEQQPPHQQMFQQQYQQQLHLQQQQQLQQTQQLHSKDARQHEQQWGVHDQDHLNRQLSLAGMEVAQNEALLNYFYDCQRKFGTMPGYGGATGNAQQQQYAAHMQMKNLYGGQKYSDNLDFFSPFNYQQQYQYQQYMQQMGQYAPNPSTGNYQYSKKEFEALEQILSSRSGSAQSSWFNQQNKMAMAMAQQYQHQQHHQHPTLPQHHQQTPPQQQPQHGKHHAINTKHQNVTSPLESDLASKVQNVSPSSVSSSAAPTSQSRRISRESPKKPAQSPRGGSSPHVQQGSDLSNTSSLQQSKQAEVIPDLPVPTATLAEKLPGYTGPSKEVQKQKKPPQQVSMNAEGKSEKSETKSSSKDDGFSISKELLDTVAAVSKLPAWKPNSERESESGASEHHQTPQHPFSPIQGPQTTPNNNKEPVSERLRSRLTSSDKTFEALVKRVESVKDVKSTPSQSESREQSDFERNDDYDDTKGGVDYDDDDDFDDFAPNKTPSGKTPRSVPPSSSSSTASLAITTSASINAVTPNLSLVPSQKKPKLPIASKNTDIFGSPLSGGRTPKQTSSVGSKGILRSGKGRASGIGQLRGARGRSKPVTIDAKALEKVHRTVAGTDYDFEDEFDDDFGLDSSKEFEQPSLQSLREQSKKQSIPIYMQKNSETPEIETNKNKRKKSISKFDEDFDGDDDDEEENKPLLKRASASRGKKRGGRGRARNHTTRVARSSRAKKKESYRELDSEEEQPLPKADPVSQPPLPKLKLGALMVTKKEAKKETGFTKTIPKLKIKLGPKPSSPKTTVSQPDPVPTSPPPVVSKSPPVQSVEEKQKAEGVDISESVVSEEPPVVEMEKEKELEEKRDKEDVEAPTPIPEPVMPLPDPLATNPGVTTEISSEISQKKASPTHSPTKKGSLIDSLAKKLLNKHSDSKSDLDSIFSPPKPLDMTTRSDCSIEPSDPLNNPSSEQKSELDLLKEELDQQHRMTQQQQPPLSSTASTRAEDSITVSSVGIPASATSTSISSPKASSPLQQSVIEKAMNAARQNNEDSTRIKHLKMKFRGIQPTVTENTTPATAPLPSIANPSDSHNPSNIRRMRKKELLNRYYGQDIYPAPSNNGPTTSTSTAPPTTISESAATVPTSSTSSSTTSQVMPPPPPAVRNIIKMPKAVASVTSVPTRADYQPQLEANLERKRKRMNDLGGGMQGFFEKNKNSKSEDKSAKKKRGRGAASKEDQDYKPKFEASKVISEEDKRENARKTRGKPPKKCLAESPPHPEPPENDLKAQHMMFAEKIRSSFDEVSNCDNALNQSGDEFTPTGGKRRSRKRRKEDGGNNGPSTKTPRIVIKFSKEGSSLNEGEKNVSSIGSNGIDSYDFSSGDSSELSKFKQQTVKFPKIKIKI